MQLAGKPPGITKRTIAARGTIVAAFVTGPSLAAFFVAWHLFGDPLPAVAAGAIVHFVALGFSLKIVKRLTAGGAGA